MRYSVRVGNEKGDVSRGTKVKRRATRRAKECINGDLVLGRYSAQGVGPLTEIWVDLMYEQTVSTGCIPSSPSSPPVVLSSASCSSHISPSDDDASPIPSRSHHCKRH